MVKPIMRSSAGKSFRFTHLSLENWRNFAKIDVALQGRVFLVGPNASGKSNLLDVFRFLRDLVSVGGGFLEAVGPRRGGVTKLRSLSARRHSDISVHVTFGASNGAELWEYELSFSQDNQRIPLVTKERVVRGGKDLLVRPNAEDERDPERRRQTYLEQVSLNKPFREVFEFFRSIRYLHIVPQLVREPERVVSRREDPYGSDFLEQIARTNERTRSAWLRRIESALRVAVPQLKELQFYRDPVRGTPHLRGNYSHWRPHGAWQNEDQFSDGTLRLLGLLWALLEGSGPLLLEEPELSLHPDVVQHIPQIFARAQSRTGRQVVMSTHSVEMLVDEGIGVDEVLLLIPEEEGTRVIPAKHFGQIVALLEGGMTMAEAVRPYTRPPGAEQLSLLPLK